MESQLLTAVIPVGPAHLLKNRINNWSAAANRFSSELKLIIVLDFNDSEVIRQVEFVEFINFEIIQGDFGSPGGARNAGLKNINSRWVCFWDCDDEPKIETFIEMVRTAESEKSEVAIGNFQKSNKGNTKVYCHNENLEVIADNPGIWRMAFSQQVCRRTAFENLSMAEDQIYVLDLLLPKRKIYFDKKSVYSYLDYGRGQLTKDKEALEQIPKAIQSIKKRIDLGKIPLDDFTFKILAKIYLTAMKKGLLLTKISIIVDYLKYVLTQNNVRIPLIKASIKVISTKYN